MSTFVAGDSQIQFNGNEIAIIGMAGRFPKSATIEQFWQNLCDSVEAVRFYTVQELLAAGISAAVLERPNYVRAVAPLEDIELFDAMFFGYSASEARLLDPQQRLFLECAVHALEHAGYDPQRYPGLIGVYAASGASTYLLYNLLRSRQTLAALEMQELLYGCEKDFLSTRVSYKLGLRGPSVNVQTACSSSLVAVHLACQSLLSGECDMALAGGVGVHAQQRRGYLYQREGYFSSDGHCRTFDARSDGTLPGSGLGLVVLKRLADALDDGDSIYALIKGTAINNDGDTKMGYSAPSIQGQAAVIRDALAVANVEPGTISFIEAHGTGTPIGDPIEIAALREVYEAHTDRKGFCAIGSVKTNIGHLDTAAGIAGLIKVALALNHACLPPHLHYERPNPQIDFTSSPFYVNTVRRHWPRSDTPRRAAISAFGIGGTNAHIILEEAAHLPQVLSKYPWQLMPLSAKTPTALEALQRNLAAHLRWQQASGTPPDLGDVTFTLQVGRRMLAQRSFAVCCSLDDAAHVFETATTGRLHRSGEECGNRPVVFLFPGGGAQHMNMGRELYEYEPLFRTTVDRCVELLAPYIDYDPLALLYPTTETTQAIDERYRQGAVPLTLLLIVEYALAQLLIAWGLVPCAMIGHSMGEYVAACLAGVFALEDVLRLVAVRERCAARLPSGGMLSVLMTEEELTPLLNERLSLAAVNSLTQCVVSGASIAIDELEVALRERDVFCRRLSVPMAGHSALLEPILGDIAEALAGMVLRPPSIPFISNLTGTWVRPDDVVRLDYWVRHLRQTVRFNDGVQELLKESDWLLLEVGPGQTLSLLIKNVIAQRHGREISGSTPRVFAAMRQALEPASDVQHLLTTVGHLWLAGAPVDWAHLSAHEPYQRIPLPTYPFERQRYWIDPDPAESNTLAAHPPVSAREETTLAPAPELYTPSVALDNEIEETLAIIWQEVLGVERIGVHDSFFDLGGDSLIGLRLITRVRETFMIDLPLKTLFENSTIALLGEAIDQHFMAEIENLSDTEVQKLFVQELSKE